MMKLIDTLLTRARDRPDRRSGRAPKFGHATIGGVRHVYNEFREDDGVEATRYGDWEYYGRCTDFC